MPRTILIADDEAHIRLVVGQRLRTMGYVVIEACDGEEALDLATEHRPDLVLTDLQMPGMSGIELCTRMRSRPQTSEIPAILLTARGYLLSPEEIASTNVRELLAKPFSVRDVAERIEKQLRGIEGLKNQTGGGADPARAAA